MMAKVPERRSKEAVAAFCVILECSNLKLLATSSAVSPSSVIPVDHHLTCFSSWVNFLNMGFKV
jgi:hypothetical protein